MSAVSLRRNKRKSRDADECIPQMKTKCVETASSSKTKHLSDGSTNEESVILHDISQCFKDTSLEKEMNRMNQMESEDLFGDEICESFDENIDRALQSTLNETDKTISINRNESMENNGDLNENDGRFNVDSINDVNMTIYNNMNMSFHELKDMYAKNLQKKVINENSKVEDISNIADSSQYRKEILQAFDACETTISNFNDDIFVDNFADKSTPSNTTLENNSIWEKTMLENVSSDIKSFNVPNNLTQLLTAKINNNKPENDIMQFTNSCKTLEKRNKIPLNVNEYSGEFYGLPRIAKSLMEQYKGIEKLYDWQEECLTLPAIIKRENLIYALPTSGGKTLVAEILMLREVCCRKKNVIFILPFVSIVQEKVWGLSPFAVTMNFLVEEYAGGKGVFPPRKRRIKKSIFIATIEKGLSLIRSLWENNRLDEIGLIVVDELHLIGEPTRGCILEMLLTNVMYSKEDIQIVGMSATIGNIEEVAKFLDAHIYMKDFRPVELKEYIKIDDRLMYIDWKARTFEEKVVFDRKIDFNYSSQIKKIDPDHLGGLVMEVIPKGSCLIFCPTKKNCENVAILLCKVIFKKLLEYLAEEKASLIKAIKAEGGGDDVLFSMIPWGVAYHHSGLGVEERRLIEDAFRAGVLHVLCCTSTLAAGVNLPAQRVILRAPLIGRSFMTMSTYKQMVGRAGRAGFGGKGDSILICQSNHVKKIRELIDSPMDKILSNMHENDGAYMRSFILGAIALEIAITRKSLRLLLQSSFLHVQAEILDVNIKNLLDKTLERLLKMGAIDVDRKSSTGESSSNICKDLCLTPHTRNNLEKNDANFAKNTPSIPITITNETKLIVSRLGRAAVKGGIELNHAHMLYADLKISQNSLVVIGVLHLLYLVTPYDTLDIVNILFPLYHSMLTKANSEVAQIAKVLGFTEYVCVQLAQGKLPKSISERVLKRFYVSLMLYDLWNQEPLHVVSEKFQINRGTIQNLITNVTTFASSVMRFCEELDEFWAFRDLLVGFNKRIGHFCTMELIPLLELPYVKKGRAMQLYKAGFKTIQSIAQAKPVDLVESIEHMTKSVANQLIAAAKLILLEKVETLREEVEEVMVGLEAKNE